MNRKSFLTLALALTLFNLAPTGLMAQIIGHWENRTSMPVKRSNMAATAVTVGDTSYIYTFMGIDSSKACGTGIHLEAYRYNTVTDVWDTVPDVPDTEGRIAASASTIDGKIYLIGGYKVFSNCNEYTSPRVDILDPVTHTWTQGALPAQYIDDHVQVVWQDSLIICVSGWSQTSNTKRVQIYDPAQDQWFPTIYIPGPGLFGHCGGISGDTIIYMDGVRINFGSFVLTNEVWMGVINPLDVTDITWTSLGQHPGNKVYRGGGVGMGDRIWFTGGTDNAYNIDGIGYNAQPSVESGRTFGYNLRTGTYEEYASNPDSVMDVRQVVKVGENAIYVIGGMSANQTVTDQVSVFVVDSVLAGNEQGLSEEWQLQVLGEETLRCRGVAASEAEIALYDLQGRKLAVLFAGRMEERAMHMALPQVPAGMYLIRLNTSHGSLSRKWLRR